MIKYIERLEFCEDLLRIIEEGYINRLSHEDILERLETTIRVIKTVCECKLTLDK